MAATESRRLRNIVRAPLLGAVPVFIAVACAQNAFALNWRIEPTLEASAIYTDNANHSENDPKDALILLATPGLILTAQGSRQLQATLEYDVSGVARVYFGEADKYDLLHRLNAAGKAELVDDFLFIDGSARVSQELISLEGSLAEAAIDNSNRADVLSYSISPYMKKRLGTFANAQARYTASGALYEDVGALNSRDTSVNALTADLVNGTRFNDLSWGLNYSIRKALYDNLPDSTFERAVASLGYALTRTFRIFGTAGQEWNDYPTLAGNEIDGSMWSAGFGWSPSKRTSIEVSRSERFFGGFYSLSARHRTRASNWNLSYTEDLNDMSGFQLTTGTMYDYQCSLVGGGSIDYDGWQFTRPPNEMGYPVSSCITLSAGMPGLLYDLRSGVFVSRLLRAGMNWGLGKLTYSLTAFDSRRDFQLVNAEDRTQGVTGALTYRLAPFTSATGSLGLNRIRIPAELSENGTDRDDDIYTFSLGVEHQFDPDLTGGLTYQRQQRDSSIANGDSRENRITATAIMSF